MGGVVINMVRPRDLGPADLEAARSGSLDREAVAADLSRAGIEVSHGLVDSLLEEARDHAARRALEDSQRAVVEALDVPSYELPRLPGGIDLGGLYELAARMREQGTGMTRDRPRVGPLAAPPSAPHPSTSTRCSTTRAPGSSCAAARAGVGKTTTSPPHSPCAPPSAGAGSWCSPSTRRAGSRSRWASRPSTTPRGRSRASAAAARSTR